MDISRKMTAMAITARLATWKFKILIVFMAFLPSIPSYCRSETRGVPGFNPTFYLDIGGGFTTYRSQMVENNDRSSHVFYTLGGNGGVDRNLGFYVKTDTNTMSFELNESAITTTWQDACLRYRLGYFYLGLIWTGLEIASTNQGTEELDAGGNGIGGTVGFQVPVGKQGVLYLDVVSAALATGRNNLTEEVSFGSRQDIDIGGSVNVTKRAIDFMVGYRIRTFAITTSNGSYAEEIYTTYIGWRWAVFF